MRSRFWDDLAEDMRHSRLRQVYRRTVRRFSRRDPAAELDQRMREALEYFESDAPSSKYAVPVETRLRARRCRCGKLAAEVSKGCHWHASVSARYAADLAAALDIAARVMVEAERLSPGAAAAAWHRHVDGTLFASPAMAQGLRDWLAGDVEDV